VARLLGHILSNIKPRMPLKVVAVVDAAGLLVGDLEGDKPPTFLLLGLLLEPMLFRPAAIYELLIPAALVVGELPVLV
jgi:hypothetical protein